MIADKGFIALSPAERVHTEGLDYTIAERHVALLSRLAEVANAGVSVFDERLGRHIFASCNFADLFGYEPRRVEQENTDYFTERIHPDDLPVLIRNGEAARRFFSFGARKDELMQTKMIQEYRLLACGKYIRVIEQFQVLELDPRGAVWLSLSMLDVSPDQDIRCEVQSKLMNYATGEIYRLPEFCGNEAVSPLSRREKDVLRLVSEGLYSKEISDRLMISVHTVNTHRQRILEKLNVDNSLEAVQYAARHGLLE